MTDSDKKEGMCCPISGCPVKNIVISTLAAFVVIFVFQWVYHGIFMKDLYDATAAMWRPEEDMEKFMHICIISKLVMALAASGLYCWAHKSCNGCCPVEGAKFGLLLGLFIGSMSFASYAWMPFETMDIPVKWLIGDVIQGILLGIALALVSRIYKKG